jgi:hypothetical protein
MKYALAIVQLVFGLGLFLCAISPAYPRGGGLDAYGCNNNRKAGGYHCHRGPLAGQFFASQEEMLRKLSPEKVETDKNKMMKTKL